MSKGKGGIELHGPLEVRSRFGPPKTALGLQTELIGPKRLDVAGRDVGNRCELWGGAVYFVLGGEGSRMIYSGVVDGDTIIGTVLDGNGSGRPWSARRLR